MHRDATTGFWVQDHAGESVACSHANAIELQRQLAYWGPYAFNPADDPRLAAFRRPYGPIQINYDPAVFAAAFNADYPATGEWVTIGKTAYGGTLQQWQPFAIDPPSSG